MPRLPGLRFAAKIIVVVMVFGLAGALVARSGDRPAGRAAMTVVDDPGDRATARPDDATTTTRPGGTASTVDPTTPAAGDPAAPDRVATTTTSGPSTGTGSRPRTSPTTAAAPPVPETTTAPPSPTSTTASPTSTTATTAANRGPVVSNASADRTQIYESCPGSTLPSTTEVRAYVSDPDGVSSVVLSASAVGTQASMQPTEPDPRATLGPFPSGTAPPGGSVTMTLSIRATDSRGAWTKVSAGTVTLYSVAC